MLVNLKANDKSYGTTYNVEYKMGNGKYMTFSGELDNVDGDAFWFRIDGCVSKFSQERVVWMMPVMDRKIVRQGGS